MEIIYKKLYIFKIPLQIIRNIESPVSLYRVSPAKLR